MTMGLTGAGLASALAAIGEAAAVAAPAAAGAGATAATVAPAVGGALAAAPVIAEGASMAAPALEAAAPVATSAGPEIAGMGMDEALGPLQATMEGDVGGMLKPPDTPLGNPMDILGGGGSPMPAPEPLPAETMAPPKPYVPTQERLSQASGGDWRKQFNTAQQALGIATALTKNKDDKKTLALLQLASGMGAANDAESTMKAMQGPLATIASSTQEKEPKMSESMSPLASAPPVVQPAMPATKTPLPSPMLDSSGEPWLTLADRLKLIRGY